MQHLDLHSWDLTPREARALQEELATRVDSITPLGRCEKIGAVDVSADRWDRMLTAGVVVWDVAEQRVIERAVVQTPAKFPYVPGLLSFREAPAILAACEQITMEPDLIICDGQGMAHPRRFGLACHLGLWLDRPTIGCAKSRLCGTHMEPPGSRGGCVPLWDGEEMIGAVLRTRSGCKPLYASVGHHCRLEDAVELILRLASKFRQPEPIRQVHQLVYETRREFMRSRGKS
jgi:deoxyribonuclease V